MARLCASNVDDNVFRRFKQLVIAKHGTLRGYFSKELTEAMRMWIEKEENNWRRELNGR